MSKRRLTQQQKKRISTLRQQRKTDAAAKVTLPEDSTLGEIREGRVIANFGSQVLVQALDLSLDQRCFLRANLNIVTGDIVVWRPGQTHGVVESRHERRSELNRPDSYGKLRTVAANVSQMLITLALEPAPHHSLIDRYLVAAHLHGLKPVLVLNKIDAQASDADAEATIASIEALYTSLGYPLVKVSAHSKAGDDELRDYLKNETSIFVGQSGVGKSSLVSMLLPEQSIRIGELSSAASKGKHTTTHSELYHFPFGGDCIDSPGIREFGLWHASPDDVLAGFKELNQHAQYCKFRDCAHEHEPGCALKAALEAGDIHPLRFDSFKLILNQLNDVTMKTQ